MLYPQLLGDEFDRLPQSLREFHSAPGGGRAAGTVIVSHRQGWLARMVGFPPAGDQIPFEIDVMDRQNGEVWTRRFGDFAIETVQQLDGDLLLETIGSLQVHFRVTADPTGMRFESQRTRWHTIPLPVSIRAEVRADDCSWAFSVTVAHVGCYRGAVKPIA